MLGGGPDFAARPDADLAGGGPMSETLTVAVDARPAGGQYRPLPRPYDPD